MYNREQPLWHHIDALMHLCHLGVTKSVTVLITTFLTRLNKYPTFLSAMQGRYEDIERLGLKWNKALAYKKGKRGGWVSENYVAHGKMIKWVYSDLEDIAGFDDYDEPLLPMDKWKKAELEDWFRARGESVQGNKPELLEKAQNLKSRPEGPPPLLKDIGMDVEDVLRLTRALSAFLARVMQTEVIPGETSNDLMLSIKVRRHTGNVPPNVAPYPHCCPYFHATLPRYISTIGKMHFPYSSPFCAHLVIYIPNCCLTYLHTPSYSYLCTMLWRELSAKKKSRAG